MKQGVDYVKGSEELLIDYKGFRGGPGTRGRAFHAPCYVKFSSIVLNIFFNLTLILSNLKIM